MEVKLDKEAINQIGNGALKELFARELSAVLDNVADPNTECKTKRKITIEVTFLPTMERDAMAVSMTCKSKLAPVNPAVAQLLLGQEGSKQVAYENRLPQRLLFKDGIPQDDDSVVSFADKRAEKS